MSSKVYQWALYLVLAGSALFSIFLVVSDTVSPFTTQAQLHIPTSRIAAEVSAPISELAVTNGQRVAKGELLVQLDSTRYQLALEQAQAALQQAMQSEIAKRQQLNGAKATLSQRQQEHLNSDRKRQRDETLFVERLVSQQQLDDSRNAELVSEQAVSAATAEVARLEAELAQMSEQGAIASAKAALELAQLDLAKTRVVAPVDGVISNLNLSKGTYVSAGSPILYLVDAKHSWINADFNEKGLAKLQPGTQVRLVFDGLPGQVFDGQLHSREQAIYDSSSDATGLAQVVNDDRWIRDQQKVRTQIHVDSLDAALFSGSKASVMVVSSNPVWDGIAQGWMAALSLLRYLI